MLESAQEEYLKVSAQECSRRVLKNKCLRVFERSI